VPGPFEKPEAPEPDQVVAILEVGSRARQLLQLGVGEDMERRRRVIWAQAERELRGSELTPERAFMHIACSNALARYHADIQSDIAKAQRAADALHAETPPTDGDQ
jgi:hypothetical protein